jgi:pimeloyl-ACP methyl ester carboxylesterase
LPEWFQGGKGVRVRFAGRFLLIVAALGLVACQTPVGVYRMDAKSVHLTLTRSALSSEKPSPYSDQVLQRSGQGPLWRADPESALANLHQGIAWPFASDRLFALAELSFLRAAELSDRQRFLTAAAYAYAFLFPSDPSYQPEPFDPRLRLAADLYNRALTLGLSLGGERIRLEDDTIPLSIGSLRIEVDDAQRQWGGYELVDFVPAAELQIRGLRNRYRRPGLGAPFVAGLKPVSERSGTRVTDVPPSVKVPVTLLLHFEDAWDRIEGGVLDATLRVYAADASEHIELGGHQVPLEYESSSALASTLDNADIWNFELLGFFGSDVRLLPGRRSDDGLILLSPYRPGRIPVVFVHGTASSPGRWADMVNEMDNVAIVREHFQPWLFVYNTGQPIAFSASLLRQSLRQALAELDPEGLDPALRHMMVVGHSQGGLLTKLTAVSSGDRFWKQISSVPIDEMDLSPEVRQIMGDSLIFEPLPFVTRVVFIATPHRGSFLARFGVSKWLSRTVTLPGTLVGAFRQMIERNPRVSAIRSLSAIPSSIDNMTPSNPFLLELVDSPIAPGVSAHSIIAVQTTGPVEEGNDGVVQYKSAHLEGVPETVVRSGHSTQSNPDTILAVGRILVEHFEAFERDLLDDGSMGPAQPVSGAAPQPRS